MGETCTYDDFLVTVEKDNQELVRELHEELTKLGCRAEIRQAKSGFLRTKRPYSITYSVKKG